MLNLWDVSAFSLSSLQLRSSIPLHRIKQLLTATFIVSLLLSPTAHATSFDCSKETTEVERMICSDPELSKLDEELSNAYKNALKYAKNSESIRNSQREWMKARNLCDQKDCLYKVYVRRAHKLYDIFKAEECLPAKVDWNNYQWIVISGRDLPVCQEMFTYLESRPNNIAPPTCPEERLPPNNNWSRPKARILSDEEKQKLMDGVPESWRQNKYTNRGIKKIVSSKESWLMRADINRDGVEEFFLASNVSEPDCQRSKICAPLRPSFKGGVVLSSRYYEMIRMNKEGTKVDWLGGNFSSNSFVLGELVYYKDIPHWMTKVNWIQVSHDDFHHTSMRAEDPYSAFFWLQEITPPMGISSNPKDNSVCRIGYFHRNNLKENPQKIRR